MAQRTKAKSGSNLKPFYMALGILAVAGLAVIGWIVMKGKKASAAAEPIAVAGADNPTALVAMAKGITVGSDDAPVKMLVFSDFQCPFCAQFASTIEPRIKEDFVNTGKLQFVFYDFPLGGLHKFSFLAARAARCAGDQNKFWQYHDAVFGHQQEWAVEQDMPLGKFLDYGKEVGLEPNAFKQCVESNKYQDVVSANRILGEKLGVGATPTVYVNSKKLPPEIGNDLGKLRELISKEAGMAAPAAAPTTTSAQ